jgi:hypothetical protein
MIDAHDIVVRFNLFERDWFKAGLNGRKIDVWCVNLGRRPRRERRMRDRHCELVKELNPLVSVVTPYEEDRFRRLRDAKDYYPRHGLNLIYPDEGLATTLKKQPSVGFYMAHRVVSEGIRISLIGYTGQTSKHHDGEEEIRILREHALIEFHETP